MLGSSPRRADLALDLGTSFTRLANAQGVVQVVPSVVALRQTRDGRVPAAVGARAREMIGRAPSHVRVVSPVRAGVVTDFEVAEHLVRHLLGTVTGGRMLRRPTVLVSVPHQLGETGRRALQDCVRASGAGRVQLVLGTLAAAVGAELPVFDPVANLIADVGGGRTEAALFSLGGVVSHRSVEVGGLQVDAEVAAWTRKAHGVVLSPTSAERLKRAYSEGDPTLRARGRDLRSGSPRDVELDRSELRPVLHRACDRIVAVVVELLRGSPPELCADLLDRGLILVGGLSEFEPLLDALRTRTGLPALPVPEPGDCTARGMSSLLRDPSLFDRAVPT